MIKKYIYDIETYPDAFVFVAKEFGSNKRDAWKIFSITDFGPNEISNLKRFITSKPSLIGYNNFSFDAQVVEEIYRGKVQTAGDIFDYAQSLIESDEWPPYRWEDLACPNLDLFVIGSYNTPARRTSLKWLEFSTRQNQIADLPFHFSDPIKSESRLKQVITYCRKDVRATEIVAELHEQAIDMRRELSRNYGLSVFNKSDSQIGEEIMLQEYCKETGETKSSLKSKIKEYDEIHVKDVILPFVKFKRPEFQEVLDLFKSLVIKKNDEGYLSLKDIYSKSIEFESCHVDYGLGGVHGCVIEPQVVRSSDTHIIVTSDVASMYPNIAIGNRFYPRHLGEVFCDIYEGIYHKRKEYPKGTALNLAYKLCLNSIYGKSNSKWSFLRDPMYTLKTTINGQLMLSMLAEDLTEVGTPLMLNTDGVEFLIPREKYDRYLEICAEWEKTTNVQLEHGTYEFMAIRDVNNYIARTEDGKVKRKGQYATWEDYKGDWHKNPSFMVIPELASNYFETGTAPEITIESYTNIFDYLAGVKKTKAFYFLILTPDEKGRVGIDRFDERVLRYYVSKNGGTAYKHFVKRNSFNALPGTSECRIKVALDIRKSAETIDKYPDLDKQYYIDEAYKLINAIEPV